MSVSYLSLTVGPACIRVGIAICATHRPVDFRTKAVRGRGLWCQLLSIA